MKPNDFSDARVLVTGGAGFIGSALVWALNRRGCDNIVVCDILGTNEKWRNLTPLRFADYVEAEELLRRAFFTDVVPWLHAWRKAKGLAPEPLEAFRASGYAERAGKERAARRKALGLGLGGGGGYA